jgi:hypothetical protein
VVRRLIQQKRFRISEQGLGEQDTDFLAALQLSHRASVERVVDIQAVEQNGRVTLRRVPVFFSDDCFELSQPHSVLVSQRRFPVELLAFLEGTP